MVAWSDSYSSSLIYRGVHSYGWHTFNVTQAIKTQYQHTGQLNVVIGPVDDNDSPQHWSTKYSSNPPVLVLDWA